jgi:hypothetical protein
LIMLMTGLVWMWWGGWCDGFIMSFIPSCSGWSRGGLTHVIDLTVICVG